MTKKYFFIMLFFAIILISVELWIRLKSRPKPVISITPEKALLDQPVEISISNLRPHEQIRVEASCKDNSFESITLDNTWQSSAIFQADKDGVVNVANQAPLSGSYIGIDPMGLFWSMKPTSKDTSKNTFLSQSNLNLAEVVLFVFSEDKCCVQKTIYRLQSSAVALKEIREQGIVGTLLYPQGAKKVPGIMIIPASTGGIPEYVSGILASHGYTVFGLKYFGVEGLPKNRQMIPLEYFLKAMQWFKKQPQVEGNKIAIMGHSMGGELGLLLASMFPDEMDAVIVYNPSSLVWGDWTYKNKAVPSMQFLTDREVFDAAKDGLIPFHKGTVEDPWDLTSEVLFAMKKNSKFIEAATIPVENIRCPLLILTGDDDKMWAGQEFGKRVVERLDAKGSKIEKKYINYPNAGHNLFTVPYAPSINLPTPIGAGWSFLGGTAAGNARAVESAWREVLEFLKNNLGKSEEKR